MDRLVQAAGADDRNNVPLGMLVLPYVAAVAMVAISTIAGTFLAPRWGNSAVDLL